MSAINLPITALKLAGQGLGLTGKGMWSAAKTGGSLMNPKISPGLIGSMTRWTVGGMILSSIPNPAARKQAIDKALYEANREAERHYTSIKEDLKRENQLRKRQREFDFTQRVIDARFLANPEDRQFEVRMAALEKKYDENLQKIEEASVQRQQDVEEVIRIMQSRRDVGFWTRAGEGIGNFGKGVGNWGIGAAQGAAGFIDQVTSLGNYVGLKGTNLHGKTADWEKRKWTKNMTMYVPDEEWTQKYGKLKDQKVTYKNGSELQIKDQKITISAKTDEDMIALTKEGNKILAGIMKNIDDAERKREQADRAIQARRNRMDYEMNQNAKTREMRSLDIRTDFDLQKTRSDWVSKSPLFSHEQKMYAAIDAQAAVKQKKLEDRLNALRTEMVETGEKTGMTSEEKAALDKKYADKHRENYDQAKAAYDKRFGGDLQNQLQEYAERFRQQKQNDTSRGLFGKAEKLSLVGGMFKKMNELSLPSKKEITMEEVRNDPDYAKEADEIKQRYADRFKQSKEYQAYQKRKQTITGDHAREADTLKNRKELRQRSDVEGHKIDKMQEIGTQKIQMEAESRKMMLDAAMRFPVRGGLEESYTMLNDDLIKQGEAQRLGGNMQQVELSDKSLKPLLDRLDKMFQKLEDKLQTGVPVKVS
jgi:hypothetical protein